MSLPHVAHSPGLHVQSNRGILQDMTHEIFDSAFLAKRGHTAWTFGEEAGLPYLVVFRIIRGKTVPLLPTARTIAATLGMPLDSLRFPKEL